eukprot:5588932-Pleurochrysis_carterae.AAC.2
MGSKKGVGWARGGKGGWGEAGCVCRYGAEKGRKGRVRREEVSESVETISPLREGGRRAPSTRQGRQEGELQTGPRRRSRGLDESRRDGLSTHAGKRKSLRLRCRVKPCWYALAKPC